MNPRFDEDDEEDTATRENEEQEEEEKEEGTKATTEVVESENSETNQLQGENKSTPKSSESLSDVDSPNHNEADDCRLYSFYLVLIIQLLVKEKLKTNMFGLVESHFQNLLHLKPKENFILALITMTNQWTT